MTLIFFMLIMLLMGMAISAPELPATCASGYNMCESNGVFDVRDYLVHLYQNLVDTVDASSHFKREALQAEPLERKDVTLLCCAEGMQCLGLKGSNMPFCWDRFTTDVYLPGGWYGSITTGEFTIPSGEMVNLITGQYANGSNIYSAEVTARPNLATMSFPGLWTSRGVGSAIPDSVLGASATETTATSTSDTNLLDSSVTATSASAVTTTTRPESSAVSTATSGITTATTMQPESTVNSSTLSESAHKTGKVGNPAPTVSAAAVIKDSASWVYTLVATGLIIAMIFN